MNIIDLDYLDSVLYARNRVLISIQNRLDAVHNAQQVGKKGWFSVQNIHAIALLERTAVPSKNFVLK